MVKSGSVHRILCIQEEHFGQMVKFNFGSINNLTLQVQLGDELGSIIN